MAGSIEKRGNNKYRLVVSGGFDVNGNRIRYSKTIEATSKSKAEKELALFISEVEKGQYLQPSKMTFKDFAHKWLEDYSQGNIEASTYRTYRDIINLRFLPEFGNYKLEQIKPLHIMDFYKKLSSDGARQDNKSGSLSSKTIRNYHTLLRSMLKDAVHWQLIPFNPVERIEPPKTKRPKINFYDDEQCVRMMKLLYHEPIKYRVLIMVCIYSGLRRGEILGLEWKNIDFEKNILIVEKTINYTKELGVFEKQPKTDNGIRKIAFSDTIKNLLLEYKDWQDEYINNYGELYHNSDKLFTQNNGKPMHPDTPLQWFSKFILKNDLPPISLHGLRHSNASILIASGLDLRTISTRLGHSQPSFTLGTYGHMLQKSDYAAANKLDEVLKI